MSHPHLCRVFVEVGLFAPARLDCHAVGRDGAAAAVAPDGEGSARGRRRADSEEARAHAEPHVDAAVEARLLKHPLLVELSCTGQEANYEGSLFKSK